MKIKLPKLDKIKKFFKKAPRFLAERAFLTFFVLFLLILVFASILFYENFILAKREKGEILEKPLFFDEELLEKILKEQEIRKKLFEEAEIKQYPDPFRGPIPTLKEELTEEGI